MKHYIIAKFIDRDNTERLYPEIKDLFDKALAIEGIEGIEIHKSNSQRDNRYGELLESKAIFDCE